MANGDSAAYEVPRRRTSERKSGKDLRGSKRSEFGESIFRSDLGWGMD